MKQLMKASILAAAVTAVSLPAFAESIVSPSGAPSKKPTVSDGSAMSTYQSSVSRRPSGSSLQTYDASRPGRTNTYVNPYGIYWRYMGNRQYLEYEGQWYYAGNSGNYVYAQPQLRGNESFMRGGFGAGPAQVRTGQ